MIKQLLLPNLQIISKDSAILKTPWEQRSLSSIFFIFLIKQLQILLIKQVLKKMGRKKNRGERRKGRQGKEELGGNERGEEKKERAEWVNYIFFIPHVEVTESFTCDIQLTFIWNWYSWIILMTHLENIIYRYFCQW